MTKEIMIILGNEAIKQMALSNNTTVETVNLALNENNANAWSQFGQLLKVGAAEVEKLAA